MCPAHMLKISELQVVDTDLLGVKTRSIILLLPKTILLVLKKNIIKRRTRHRIRNKDIVHSRICSTIY